MYDLGPADLKEWPMNNRPVTIDPMSVLPLYLQIETEAKEYATGTGFCVRQGDRLFLITNWHNLSGRDPATGKYMPGNTRDPVAIQIFFHASKNLGSWFSQILPLKNADGTRTWLEHPNGRAVDVAALPLDPTPEVRIFELDPKLAAADLYLTPSETVSIIGFPFGKTASHLYPIWKTGHIASEIDLDFEGKPVFLVDATTRPGMSGSPVMAVRFGLRRTSKGIFFDGATVRRFLGIYSGRIHDKSEIAMVWKPHVIQEVLEQRLQDHVIS
jgi:hypothetical protein